MYLRFSISLWLTTSSEMQRMPGLERPLLADFVAKVEN
jgi:hypothetical protein